MNANAILDENMTLEEKLAAIDQAMAALAGQTKQVTNDDGTVTNVPIDPADATMCVGCQ
ncbi:hypothetical protein GII36_00470 [Candidatus Mycosynbacter amalyticus]|uniref:Uncharacterized protein n=1 Tax=Candidatus Mycosynbacter amalyticus TaxID=2665156 RepID=A0A857ML48_9BACT|nr:hypothetical protein [Candidatus Mycosynbacter amalyticus]QHN42332.1 hypothetical protein GII36_00470 [Candidatus Mycosynbacter amalyticus]